MQKGQASISRVKATDREGDAELYRAMMRAGIIRKLS